MSDPHAPPLCPLEAELEALMQIELTEDLEEIPMDDLEKTPVCDLDNFRRSSLSVRRQEERTAEVAALRLALRRLCLAVEERLEDETTADLQDHYEGARAALGEPCTLFPGGVQGTHFHCLEFDALTDCCYYCDQHAQAQEAKEAADGRAVPSS